MSHTPTPEPLPGLAPIWADAQREADFHAWLAGLASSQGVLANTVRSASAFFGSVLNAKSSARMFVAVVRCSSAII